MSRLEELIAELCPDGVEYKKLGDIATISRGGNFQKSDFCDNGFPCIHYGQIYTRYGMFANKTVAFINQDAAKKSKKAVSNDIIMAVTSENIEDVCKCVAWLGDEEIAVSGHTAIIHHDLNTKYLVYYFHSSMFYKQKIKFTHGTKVIEVTPNKLIDISIPVPPLEVQSEIVRILDNFMELTTELIAELATEFTARKKQYEYYRDDLLNTEYDTVLFGDIASIVRGASPRPIKEFVTDSDDGVNWIKIGDVKPNTKYITTTKEKITKEGAKKSRFVKQGDFILSNSMSFGRPYIIKNEGCIHDGWLSISGFSESYIPDFLYHLLNSNMMQNTMKQKASNGGAVSNLNADIVKSLELPLVPLKEQERIVDILDRFDSLCNDITTGLSAEIEARQKQYEYYRDKLLTFKELS